MDAVNAMLKRLEGKTLDYTALARDTPAGGLLLNAVLEPSMI